ncbi:MAG TPA: ribokinase [Terriglobia bacterium]|nr:ribokinase [Terriglobia bacterium]
MAGKIVVVGSLNMDLVACASRIPVAGETITGHTFFDGAGGKGANQAFAAARLGGRVSMLGRVGDDDYGRRMRSNLEQAGCDVSGVETIDGSASGIALIFVADSGQNSIVIVPGANSRFSPQHVEAAHDDFQGATSVLLQLENPLPTVIAAAHQGRAAGARVILDPAPAQPLPDELFRLIDILTPNETEAAILAGLPPGRVDVPHAMAIAHSLRERGAGTVVVKLGDQGCVLAADGAARHLPVRQVEAVDTTAAGDVFNGALAVALSEGMDLASACGFANRAAAVSVTRMGTQVAAPRRDEVDAFAS